MRTPSNKALWKTNVAHTLKTVQKRNNWATPISHSTKDWTRSITNPLIRNLLQHWNTVLNRSPVRLKKGDWVATLRQDETPYWIYQIKETVKWKRDKKGKMMKTQQVPVVQLNWYPDNDLSRIPQEWDEKSHALVPITIKLKKGVIIDAIASFPTIHFLNINKNDQIFKQ